MNEVTGKIWKDAPQLPAPPARCPTTGGLWKSQPTHTPSLTRCQAPRELSLGQPHPVLGSGHRPSEKPWVPLWAVSLSPPSCSASSAPSLP